MEWIVELFKTLIALSGGSPLTLLFDIAVLLLILQLRREQRLERRDDHRSEESKRQDETVLSLVNLTSKLVEKLDTLTDEWRKANDRQEESNRLEEKRIEMRKEIALSNDETVKTLGTQVGESTKATLQLAADIRDQMGVIRTAGEKLGEKFMSVAQDSIKEIGEQLTKTLKELTDRLGPIQLTLEAQTQAIATIQQNVDSIRGAVPSDLSQKLDNIENSLKILTDGLNLNFASVKESLSDLRNQFPKAPEPPKASDVPPA